MQQDAAPARSEEAKKFGLTVMGAVIYALSVNLFIVPMGLYSGGFIGISQIVRTLLRTRFGIGLGAHDISSLLNYAINIPILLAAWRKLDRKFVFKTVTGITVMTAVMASVPVTNLMKQDVLTSCLVGGVISGVGVGLILRAGATLGGMDVLSMIALRRFHNLSVGKAGLAVNVVLYGLCMVLFDVQTAVYSLVYSFVLTTTMDRFHWQNIDVEATIITKADVGELEHAITRGLHRGATLLRGTGAYTDEDVSVVYVILSKYEIVQLRQILQRIDPHAFLCVKDHVRIYGNYSKHI